MTLRLPAAPIVAAAALAAAAAQSFALRADRLAAETPAEAADALYEGIYKCNPRFIYYERSEVTGYTEHNPHHCGLILYASPEEAHVRGNRVGSCCLNVGAELMNNYKLSIDEELKLLRLLGMRVWNLKKKLAEYQAEPSLFKR